MDTLLFSGAIQTPSLGAMTLSGAKWAFTTRRVRRWDALALSTAFDTAVPGDLVLAEVVSLGNHQRLQLAEGRPSNLYEGDQVVVAVGNRYAPDQFEGVAEINDGPVDLLAGGGVIGRMRERHAKMRTPTKVKPIGLLTDAPGDVLNVGDYALPRRPKPEGMTVIGVIGASMNSGKTTATASLARGLHRAGYRVAAIKATGTGAFGDYNMFADTGVPFVADFTDAGMATTYLQPVDQVVEGMHTLLGHAAAHGCEIALVELADGVFQKETAAMLKDPAIRSDFDGFIMATPDALAATGGAAVLKGMDIEPLAMTGLISLSPLAVMEATEATGLRVVTRQELRDPAGAVDLIGPVMAARSATQQQIAA